MPVHHLPPNDAGNENIKQIRNLKCRNLHHARVAGKCATSSRYLDAEDIVVLGVASFDTHLCV